MRSRPAPPAALALVALLASAPPAAANPFIEGCLDPTLDAATAADQCRRAVDWGGLAPAEVARAWTSAGIALSVIGRDGDALAAYDAAIAADPGFWAAWPNRALSRARRGMAEGALADWAEAISRRPRDWEARLARAGWLIRWNRPGMALEDLDAALRIVPREPDVHYNRGLALAALGRGEAAAAAFDRTLTLAPGDPDAHLQRALVRGESDPARALADLDAAIRLRPEWAEAHALRGRLHEQAGRVDAADADYRRAFELGFQAPWLNERIRALGG